MMKRWLTYGLVVSLLLVSAVLIYFYREYMVEDTDPTAAKLVNPLIPKRLNAIVTKISTTKASNLPTVDVAYTDLDTKEATSVRLNNPYGQSIHMGDTLTKEKGEKILLIYQKDGNVATVAID